MIFPFKQPKIEIMTPIFTIFEPISPNSAFAASALAVLPKPTSFQLG